MDDLHFLRPLLLWFTVPSLLVWLGLWRLQDNVDSWARVIDQHLLEHLIVGESNRPKLRPIHLLLLLWVVTSIVLAGPTWKTEPSPFADDEAGLVVLLKVSGTMLATDVQPSRLDRAKLKLRDLLEAREGAATGLIVYSGSAHLVMPLTRDDRIISAMVEDLTPDLMPEDGDALADALRLAEQVLDNSGAPGSVLVMADNVSPAQVQLIADGENVVPVQFLSVQAFGSLVDGGLEAAAASLSAPVVELAVEPTDVEKLAQRAATSFKSVSSVNEGERWIDAGYFFLPLLALMALMWSRRGWLVR
jgi:Ca-activated chloride channel family protein